MMALWFISLLVMAIICAILAAWWGDNKPCYQCMSYKRAQHQCDGCNDRASVFYCYGCVKSLYKRRTPRVKKFLALIERIKKIRRGRKNK
jgi:uncharacterized paraquat-inducible protein A